MRKCSEVLLVQLSIQRNQGSERSSGLPKMTQNNGRICPPDLSRVKPQPQRPHQTIPAPPFSARALCLRGRYAWRTGLGSLCCRMKAGARIRAWRWAAPMSLCTPSRIEAASRVPLSSAFSCGAHIKQTTCPSSWWATRLTWHAAGKSPWKVSPPLHPPSPASSQSPVTAPPPVPSISGTVTPPSPPSRIYMPKPES